MNFTNRVTSAACFDEKSYAEIALDAKGTRSALLVVLLAGLSFGIGLHRANVFGWIDGVVATWVVFCAATTTAFLAAHKYDPSAWRWQRALRAIRILGYSMAPGLVGLVGFVFGKSVVVAVGIWCAFSFLYAVRLAFDYKPERIVAPIGFAIVLVSVVMIWVYSDAIRGGFGFLMLVGFLGVCLFHKAVLRWLYGCSKSEGETGAVQRGLWTEVRIQWETTRELFRKKGWDVSLRELVETFTLIKIRRRTRDGAAPAPPPIPKQPCHAKQAKETDRDETAGNAESSGGTEAGPTGSGVGADLPDAEGKLDDEPENQAGNEDETKAKPRAEPEMEPEVEPGRESDSALKDEDENAPSPAGPEAEAGIEEGPGIQTVCDRIFDEKISGYESTRIFRDEFKGKSVTWRGAVKAVEQYTYDTVFGGEPGVKVLIETAEIKTEYETLPVEVALRLPPDKLEKARAGVGKTISFAGELIENDPYARRLYVVGRLDN